MLPGQVEVTDTDVCVCVSTRCILWRVIQHCDKAQYKYSTGYINRVGVTFYS